MVGRERELRLLRHAAGSAEAGAVRVVLVLGEAGVGKTRLAQELVASLDETWLTLTSHGVPLAGTEVPFGGAAELVRTITRMYGAAEVRRRTGRDAALLALLVPSVADPPADAVDRADVIAAVMRLVEALDRPVCWLADDAQWLDRSTRDLLLYAERVMSGALLVVATVRTPPDAIGVLPQDLAELGRRAEVVELGPLSTREVRDQIAGLASGLPAEALTRICELSDGLPFYVEQLATEGGRVAGSLRTVLRARLDRLSPPARHLLAAAAVGEGLLAPSHLRAVTRLGAAFDRALDEVRTSGVLVRDPQGDGLRFHHALLKDAVDRDLLGEDRRRWHQAWASHLDQLAGDESQDLRVVIERARHHDAVGGAGAFEAAIAAAEAAELTQDEHARRHWWHRAFTGWPDDAPPGVELTRDAVLSRLYAALWSVGDMDVIDDLLKRELADENEWLRSLWLRLLLWRERRAQQAEFTRVVDPSEAEKTLARLRSYESDLKVASVMVHLADEWIQDLPDLTEAMLHEVIDQLAPVCDPLLLADAWDLLAWLQCCRGDPDAAVRVSEEHVAWMERHHPAGVLDARCRLVVSLANAERPDEALALLERTVAETRHPHLHPHLWVVQHMLRAVMHLLVGAWDDMAEDLDRAREGAFGGDIESWWNALSGIRSARTGDIAAARSCLDAIPQAPPGTPPGLRWSREAIQRTFIETEIAAAEGDRAGVCRAVSRTIALQHDGEPSNDLYEAFVSGLRSGVRRGEPDPEARVLVAQAATVVDGPAPDANPVLALRPVEIAEHLRRVGDRDTVAGWSDIAARWSRCHRPYDAAHAYLFAAECAARDGDRPRARELFAGAHGISKQLGADPLRERIEAAARRSRITGFETSVPAPGLTARETEVLGLLVDGLSNGAIAEQLVMSPKTVSVHVSHIIAKLGVANRTEATARALRDGLTTGG